MQALKNQHQNISFEGIGGPLMIAEGLQSMVPIERLSVMGFIEPLKRLPELLGIRKGLIRHFLQNRPDIFIGIDSPDFNLTLEEKLKEKGVLTAHYVSPSVWAWRSKRIHKIKRAANMMLTLFPFEEAFYTDHAMRVRCVGHPLADMIPLEVDKTSARVALNLEQSVQVLALLPGSRSGEVGRLTPEFLACAELCAKRWPDMQFVIPCANPARREQIEGILNQQFQHLAVTLVDGRSREVMAASDAILIASGTATLEALLLKKPMLVCYKMSALSYALISRMLKVPYFSLPNLLAGKKLVEERVQNEVNAPALMNSLHTLLEDEDKQKALNMEYLQIHQTLRRNANSKAAEAVLELISQQGNADIAVP